MKNYINNEKLNLDNNMMRKLIQAQMSNNLRTCKNNSKNSKIKYKNQNLKNLTQ